MSITDFELKLEKQKQFQVVLQFAQDGKVDAMREVYYCYKNGGGVEKNYDKAINWLMKATETGDAEAQFLLYQEEPDDQKSFEWLEKSAKSNYSEAIYLIAKIYHQGNDRFKINPSPNLAFTWFTTGVGNKDFRCYHYLGEIYLTGCDASKGVDLN